MYNTIATKSNTATDTNTSPIHLNDRYRPRNIGIGYGKSSGYASTRQYASTSTNHLVRVR
jgi:hypothetical protein